MPKLTRFQWINLFAAIPAAISLAVLTICLAMLATFWLVYHGMFIGIACIVVLVFAGFALMRGLLGR